MFVSDRPKQPPVLPYPTPLPGISDMFEELGQFVRQSATEQDSRRSNPHNTGDSSFNDSTYDAKNLNFEFSSPITRKLFSNAKTFFHIFRSLQSIQNAKSFIYTLQ